ncbi:hypothetical protein PCE1_004381 [Barthelona sp. PCE]
MNNILSTSITAADWIVGKTEEEHVGLFYGNILENRYLSVLNSYRHLPNLKLCLTVPKRMVHELLCHLIAYYVIPISYAGQFRNVAMVSFSSKFDVVSLLELCFTHMKNLESVQKLLHKVSFFFFDSLLQLRVFLASIPAENVTFLFDTTALSVREAIKAIDHINSSIIASDRDFCILTGCNHKKTDKRLSSELLYARR